MTNSPWLVTAHGADHPLTGATVLLPDNAPRIEVIAHALAQINRFTGHASRPYSVAEHSVLVCDIVAARGGNLHAQMAALLHDAHEAFCGDVATPIKWALGAPWLGLENMHALAVREAFAIKTAHVAHRAAVKQADMIALATERRDLMRYDTAQNTPWPALDTPGQEVHPLDGVDLNNPARAAMTWHHHRDTFLQRYRTLDARRCGRDFSAPLPTTTKAMP